MSTKDMTQSIMRRKPIDDIEVENKHSGLFKSLGLWQLTAIGVGGIIGVGIFSLAGLVAAGSEDAPGVGPAVLFSFLIAGLASAAAALSYAEFAGMIPRAGSAYTYGYVALGEVVGWFIGWTCCWNTLPSWRWWPSASPATSTPSSPESGFICPPG
ncbi:cationic amino acid transporter 3, mitochondrial [Arthrobacter sp. Hiyo4]|nr:cationic amino acid transporter 3, mitochondrial [Arthrobacter sp. Hiyo4]